MLNIWTRLVPILAPLLLLGIAFLVALGLFMPGVREQSATVLTGWIEQLDAMTFAQRLIGALIAAAVAALAFLMLVVELRPGTSSTVRVKAEDGSVTTIEREAISQRVQYAVDMLDDVVGVSPRIAGRGEGLSVHLDVVTTPVVDIPMKTTEIRETTRRVIEEQMGLHLKKLTLKVDHSSLGPTPGKETL